jgi:hypothetical protein
MTALAFDTLAYAKKLRAAGIPEVQAEAQTAALAEALKEGAGELATRADIVYLEGRIHLVQWIIGFNLALTVAVPWLLIRH